MDEESGDSYFVHQRSGKTVLGAARGGEWGDCVKTNKMWCSVDVSGLGRSPCVTVVGGQLERGVNHRSPTSRNYDMRANVYSTI